MFAQLDLFEEGAAVHDFLTVDGEDCGEATAGVGGDHAEGRALQVLSNSRLQFPLVPLQHCYAHALACIATYVSP